MFFLFAKYWASYIVLSRIWIALRSHFLRPKIIVCGIFFAISFAVFPLNSRRVSPSGMKNDFAGTIVGVASEISSNVDIFWNEVGDFEVGAIIWWDFARSFIRFGRLDLGIVFCIWHLFIWLGVISYKVFGVVEN